MTEVAGKRLLVLGGGNSTLDVVKSAKAMGMYVICVGLEETGVSKELADESYLISTNDFEKLSKLIADKKIDGVFTGASEFNCQNMIQLAHRNGLPCYCTMDQWKLMQNKRSFKETCRQYGVGVVPEYAETTPANEIIYPVIIKPTDSCSAQGMSICRDAANLQNSLDFAYEYSASKSAIIERYMQCDSVASYYTVQDGIISFSHIIDWYRYKNKDGVDAITASLIYPSKYLQKYLEKADGPIREMIKGIGFENGCINFQIFVENDEFYVFECGLRIPGSYDYPIIDKLNGINYMEMMIEYAVNGSIRRYDGKKQNDPTFGGKWAANVAVMLNKGTIAEVKNLDKVLQNQNVLSMTAPPQIGHTVTEKDLGTLLQTYSRFNVISASKAELHETIAFIFSTLSIIDTAGNNMMRTPIDYSVI